MYNLSLDIYKYSEIRNFNIGKIYIVSRDVLFLMSWATLF